MKRIPSKIALCNVLAGIVGKQKVRIVDFENTYDLAVEKNGTIVFEGEEIDTYNYKYTRYTEAEYCGMRLDGDVLEFHVLTKFEQYK